MSQKNYFITGATGFLGGEFLRTVLAQDSQASCYCLVRDQGSKSAEERLQASDKVFIVSGDITRDNLGLTSEQYQALAEKITHVVHIAAMVKFEKPKEVLEKINVRGTANVLTFAKHCKKYNPEFQVLGYVGTAYVAGKMKGLVTENYFSDTPGFKNDYEATKYAAEALLHAAQSELPITIFRPSIILGDSREGKVSRSNVIFPLVKVARKDPFGLAPFKKNCLMDLVTVDYVATAMYFLLQEKASVGQAFHLTCGAGNEMTIAQMIKQFNQVYDLKFVLIPAWLWPIGKKFFSLTRAGQYYLKGVEPYWLYTVENPQFCQKQSLAVLEKYGLQRGNTQDFLQQTLHYMKHQFFTRKS